ncbi:type II/IV secretion system protein [Litorilituus lipolyticus]|uniref:Type II/IV secretion system protein n=1 Tax=Litorilituus lipolyticus TaxID=2491017 RepID=A0A502LGG0_9GAMM|nr:type II/IV secretion system protein [Litorilituus lipolyticus]
MISLLENEFNLGSENIEKAVAFQLDHGGRIESILENMGLIDESDIALLYSTYFKLKLFTAKKFELDGYALTDDISIQAKLNQFGWLLCSNENEERKLITCDPFNVNANQYVSSYLPDTELAIMQRSDVESIIKHNENLVEESNELTLNEVDKLKEAAKEAPVVNLLNSLILKGLKLNASDMHIEPLDNYSIVRYRVDGVLVSDERIARSMELPLVTRLKILSNMDIAEKRRPQDGKIETRVSGQELDIRVSCLPLAVGESFVLRFLKKESLSYNLEALGMEHDVQALIENDITKTSGVILLTGPTGSGKTTTLYSCLSKLNSERTKIITLEDPVEYQLENVNQVQVNPEIGFDFAEGLRSIVRQDPDIIMLGEIRDQTTAKIAMQSALTGHLVFSTVHTNDAPSAYTRLLDLGVDSFLLDAALLAIIAQRLARKLCTNCCKPSENPEELIAKYNLELLTRDFAIDLSVNSLKQAVGCDECGHTGYKGRIALIEYMRCDEDISLLNKDEAFLVNARKVNKARGYRNLLVDGVVKALKGQTTIEEVVRVAG